MRNPQMLAFARPYGLTIATCVPADPRSKGGSENAVKIAKAGLVPTEVNLLGAHGSFAELEAACATFCEQVNARPPRVSRRAPAEMLMEEQQRLHHAPRWPRPSNWRRPEQTAVLPPLDAELEQLLKRMPTVLPRSAAPEILSTAKAQREDPPR